MTRLSTLMAEYMLARGVIVGAALSLAACETGAVSNGEACLYLDVGTTCPSEDEASDQLVGTTVGDCPIKDVLSTGELVSHDTEVEYYPNPYDTASEPEIVDRCCYEAKLKETPACIGRPLRDADGGFEVAPAITGGGWTHTRRAPDLDGLSSEAREALAAYWTDQALLEHASVAAFSKLILDLLALGAPRDLVERSQRALQDEIRHAGMCFELASAFAGAPVAPGPLPIERGEAPTFASLALETLRDGCIGETLAVAMAVEQLRHAADPAVRTVLSRIITDETRHAELAWDTLSWATSHMEQAEVSAMLAAARQTHTTSQGRAQTTDTLRRYGLLSQEELEAAASAGVTEVVLPMLQAA